METTITYYKPDGTQRTNTYRTDSLATLGAVMDRLSRRYTVTGSLLDFIAYNDRETVLVTTI